MTLTTKYREEVYNKYNGKCGYCGIDIEIKNMQVDHIISQSNFIGDVRSGFFVPYFLKHLTEKDINHIDNLMPSCRKCNHYKSAFTLGKFRNEIGYQIERLNKHTGYGLAKRFGIVKETGFEVMFYFEKLR